MNTKEKIIQLLKNLGSSSEEIAKCLADQGIKGKIKNGRNCPVSNFIKSKLDVKNVVTSPSGISFLNFKESLFCQDLVLWEELTKFIIEFDNDSFSDLVEK